MKKIKNHIKYIVVILLTALLSIVATKTFYPTKIIDSKTVTEYVPVTKYVDKSGITRSEYEAVVLSRDQFKAETKELKKLLKGNHKIESVSDYVVGIDTTVKNVVAADSSVKDSVLYFSTGNNYLKQSVKVNLVKNLADFKLQLKDTITQVTSRKGGFLFFSKEKIITTLNSKGNTIKFYEGRTITQEAKRPIIVFTIGGYYDPIFNRGGVAITGGLPILTIKTNK